MLNSFEIRSELDAMHCSTVVLIDGVMVLKWAISTFGVGNGEVLHLSANVCNIQCAIERIQIRAVDHLTAKTASTPPHTERLWKKMPLTQKQIDPLRDRLHSLVEDVGELNIFSDNVHGEDSKQSYMLCDALALLEAAYEMLTFGKCTSRRGYDLLLKGTAKKAATSTHTER